MPCEHPCPGVDKGQGICYGRGSCSDGFSGTGRCTCQEEWQAPDCLYAYCFGKEGSQVCSSRGKCTSPNVCTCDQPALFTGRECQTPICYGLPSTDPLVCGQHGRCTVGPITDLPICLCNEGYTGVDCTLPVCFGYVIGVYH
jgi:hypothetical protein